VGRNNKCKENSRRKDIWAEKHGNSRANIICGKTHQISIQNDGINVYEGGEMDIKE
jgi:hypothetical protein